MVNSFVVGLFLFGISSSFAVDMPNYIKPCAKDVPNLKQCIIDHATEALPKIVDGDEEFGIPNMKPLKVPEVTVDGGILKLKLSDCNIFGLDGAEVKDADFDLEKNHGSMTIHIPNLNIQSNYDASGRLLVLPISGQGSANITNVGGDYTFEFDWELEEKDGEEFAKITNHKFEYDVDRGYYRLDNLFNGNKYLGEEMNRFLDENWKGVNKALAPAVTKTVGKICNDIMGGFLEKVPYKSIFA